MCIRTAIKASLLCLTPAVVAFAAAGLAVQLPRVFLAVLGLSLAASGYVALHSYVRTGRADIVNDAEPVEVAAGVLLAISFLFGFWTGLGQMAGLGLLPAGVVVAVGTALLAALLLTFVKRVISGGAPRLDQLVQRFFPAGRPAADGRAA